MVPIQGIDQPCSDLLPHQPERPGPRSVSGVTSKVLASRSLLGGTTDLSSRRKEHIMVSLWKRRFRRPAESRGRARFPLRLEELEPRDVPTIFVVTTPAAGGPGSLRQAVLDSNDTPGEDQIHIPA